MFGNKVWIFVCLVLLLAGCDGASSRPPPNAPSSGPSRLADSESSSSESAPASEPGRFPSSPSKSAESVQPSPPPPAASPSVQITGSADSSGGTRSSARAEVPAPKTRPGLGTEFGERRVSHVHDVSFVRDSGRPFAVATLNYNDRNGVNALASMASRRGGGRSFDTGGGAVTITVRDENGEPLEAVHVGDRTFVVGQAGQRYSIVLENHTSHRFEAVGTVDGLDVINGKPGTLDNRGYVLLPFATLEIDGFRTSSSSVAAFRFASVADSYAARTGSARNVGVIGLAFFSERGDSFVPESETRLRDTANPFPNDRRFAQPPPRR